MKPQKSTKDSRDTTARVIKIVLSILCLFVADTGAQESQSRGRQIYMQGTSRSGKDVLAYIGDESLEVPASTITCAGCHGFDGRGKSEGGINPSNVTWEFLTKPYGLKHASGRQHPPYTERGLELAITRGTDPGGNKLLPVMPRYAMSREDLADLVAYLQLLGKEREPGVSENTIVIGTMVEATGPLSELGRGVTAVTTAYFAELNSQGGIFGRRLELRIVETANAASDKRAKLESALKEQQMFAMSAALIAGAEKELVPLFSQHETPLIGPFSLYGQSAFPANRQIFYLLSGIPNQARSLINFIGKKPEFKNFKLAVISPQLEVYGEVIEAARDQTNKLGSSPPLVIQYAPGRFDVTDALKQARQASVDVVILMGTTDEAMSFMSEAEKIHWFPVVLSPAGTIGAAVFTAPPGFDGKVFFSFATAPVDHTAEAIKEFRALAEKYKLPSTHAASQVAAYAAAKVLVEAIRRAGKDVTREKLIQVLEGFHQYPTGLTPAVTYGPNRRTGSMGAYIITVDLKEKKFVPASEWIESN